MYVNIDLMELLSWVDMAPLNGGKKKSFFP